MDNCNRCTGVCRCGSKTELCLIAGTINTIDVPCPTDLDGCVLDSVADSLLELRCPCCDVLIQSFTDPLTLSHCNPCRLSIDLTDTAAIDSLKNSQCKLNYRLFVNGDPYLTGSVCLDWRYD